MKAKNNSEKSKKRKLKKIGIYRLLITILLIMGAIFNFYIMYKLNIIPLKYIAIYLLSILLILFLSFRIFYTKKKLRFIKLIWTIITTIIVIVLIIASIYLYKTNSFFNNIKDLNYKTEKYNILVLNNNEIKTIEDLNNKTIEYVDNKDINYEEALTNLSKKIKFKSIVIEDYEVLLNNTYNKKTNSILIEDTNLKQLKEIYPNIEEKLKTIYTFTIKIKQNSIVKEVDVSKKAFNVYISGLDTYGSIAQTSRSDVNMIITVNPNTHQILLTSIPRDYYVQLKDTTGYKDKLTHAGIYGIESSVGTLENLLDIDINYYVKVNFSTLINIIDAIGGIEAYNSYSFTGHENTYFPSGYVNLNGKEALEFSRTRKTLRNGDNDRIKNQQSVVNGLINKLTSKKIITKYSDLLNSLNNSFVTNISTKEITSLIKMQLNDMSSWTITSNVLEGYDSSNYTYTYPNQLLYVMSQNEESVNKAKELIKLVLKGEILDNSYIENTGAKNPTHETNKETTPIKNQETEKTEIKPSEETIETTPTEKEQAETEIEKTENIENPQDEPSKDINNEEDITITDQNIENETKSEENE